MDIDELLLSESINCKPADNSGKKERLLSIAVSGKSKYYLGENLTTDQIQMLSPDEIIKYHARYQSVLSSKLAKNLTKSIIDIYVKCIAKFFNVNSEDLIFDLNSNPIVIDSLGTITCDLYYRFGKLMSPIVAGLISLNHINFTQVKNDGPDGPDRNESGTDNTTCRVGEEKPTSVSNEDKKSWESGGRYEVGTT